MLYLPVHPHTGGEHLLLLLLLLTNLGSSPHGWGTLKYALDGDIERRFIPTRVGNTTTRFHGPCSNPVHPHTGGEHKAARCIPESHDGSSPHGWGTHFVGLVHQFQYRFIPTRVGNTIPRKTYWTRQPVHPHTGGEHPAYGPAACCACGSSPHGWGTLPINRKNTR